MEGNVLEIENIQYSYDRKNMILTNFTLKIKRGGIVAILGHNGAGKTTLLRLIGKLIQPHKGSIQWDLTADEKIGYMPEGLGLYPRLSGYENMKLQFLSANKKPDKELILSVLNKIELGEHIKK
ncbi:MAG: ATP-binding cassette domain-containing protein, partial [Treponema sp.]|nr:ATP-binding cassette domain-containing protein [Treponema sp.]